MRAMIFKRLQEFQEAIMTEFLYYYRNVIGSKTVKWLGEEALRRYLKLKPPSFVPNRQEVVHDIRKTVGGAICDPEDILKDILDDNDFVSIGKLSDQCLAVGHTATHKL